MRVVDKRQTPTRVTTARTLAYGGFYYGTVKGFYTTAKGLFYRTNGAMQFIPGDFEQPQSFSLESAVEVVRVHGRIVIERNA